MSYLLYLYYILPGKTKADNEEIVVSFMLYSAISQ